jgi:hypothetical protein
MFIPLEHEDDDGCRNRYAKEIYCGKEWCPACGKNGSGAHNRRVARWLLKIRQWKSMRYTVLTMPKELREQYRDPLMLTMWADGVRDIFKSHGCLPHGGLRRFHFYGDKSPDFNPHLNVMTEGSFIEKKVLGDIKAGCAALLGICKTCDLNGEKCLKLKCQKYDFESHYTSSPGKMFHNLKYVTRATFKDSAWDEELACLLRGFRNMVVWGRPDKVDKLTGEVIPLEWRDHGGELAESDAAWSLSDLNSEFEPDLEGEFASVSKLESMLCPACKKPLRGGKALPRKLLELVPFVPLGAGYYQLEDKRALAGPARASPVVKTNWQDIKKARGEIIRSEVRVETSKRRAAWILEKKRRGWD